MSILSYFKPTENDSLHGEALHSTSQVTGTQVCVARELNRLIEGENTKIRRQIVPVKIKKEVAFRANKYGIPTAREWAKKQIKEFKRETVRDWRNKYRDMYIE